jgi:hypothetical protein
VYFRALDDAAYFAVMRSNREATLQYIALIHKHTDSSPTADEWDRFFGAAKATGMFKGGSEIGSRQTIGQKVVSDTTESVGGYMRFDSDDPARLNALLQDHPVVRHGGTIELCEMPKS